MYAFVVLIFFSEVSLIFIYNTFSSLPSSFVYILLTSTAHPVILSLVGTSTTVVILIVHPPMKYFKFCHVVISRAINTGTRLRFILAVSSQFKLTVGVSDP
jgi:hypothetical protein